MHVTQIFFRYALGRTALQQLPTAEADAVPDK